MARVAGLLFTWLSLVAADAECDSGECSAAASDDASLLHVRREAHELGNFKENATVKGACASCGHGISVVEAEFVNNCKRNIIMIWGGGGDYCIVPAGQTCKLGSKGSCKAPAGSKYTSCSDVGPRKHYNSNNRLEWFYEGSRNDATGMLELTSMWMFPNVGKVGKANYADQQGFTMASRFEMLEAGSNTPYCTDYGMETSYPDNLAEEVGGGKWKCNDGMQVVPKPPCNSGQGLCKCPDGNFGRGGWCQQDKVCNYIRDNSKMLIKGPGGASHRCLFMSTGKYKCGKPSDIHDNNKKCSAPNYWYTDDAAHAKAAGHNSFSQDYAAGILLHPSCCSGKPAKMRFTTCGIAKVGSDPAFCTCGASPADPAACCV